MKTIRPKSGDMRSLKLSPEEGFVLSRVDGPTSVKDLVALTGLEEGRVVEIVGRLATEGALDVEGHAASAPPAATTGGSASVPAATRRKREEDDDEEEEPPKAEEAPPATESDAALEAEDAEAREADETNERNYRQIYETIYHPMDRDKRMAAAATVDGGHLMALCLDPDPQVIHVVLTNPHTGFDHARMIAIHHKTHVGLEMLGRRSELCADGLVQRRLLGNPQIPDALLRKIVHPKQIMDVYKICINREYPERSRIKTRELLQKKFMVGSADERAALLIKTEGRCLLQLVNVALDARTTQLLVAKTTYTVLFIQNLARWGATPPQLLAHLLKQPVVRMNMGLRKMLLKHPNMPAEVKRNFTA